MSKGKGSLAEIMGRKAESAEHRELSISDLKELLGEGMPKLDFHRLGRVRLLRALKQRFGPGYRNVPGISNILKEFDEEASFELKLHKMKLAKKERENGKHS